MEEAVEDSEVFLMTENKDENFVIKSVILKVVTIILNLRCTFKLLICSINC